VFFGDGQLRFGHGPRPGRDREPHVGPAPGPTTLAAAGINTIDFRHPAGVGGSCLAAPGFSRSFPVAAFGVAGLPLLCVCVLAHLVPLVRPASGGRASGCLATAPVPNALGPRRIARRRPLDSTALQSRPNQPNRAPRLDRLPADPNLGAYGWPYGLHADLCPGHLPSFAASPLQETALAGVCSCRFLRRGPAGISVCLHFCLVLFQCVDIHTPALDHSGCSSLAGPAIEMPRGASGCSQQTLKVAKSCCWLISGTTLESMSRMVKC